MEETVEKIKKFGMTDMHKKLQDVAIGWLYEKGCSVYAKEVPTKNGNADALGIRTRDKNHTVYYIEAKASRSDLICFKQKACYMRSLGEGKSKCYLHTFRGLDGKPMREDDGLCSDCMRIHLGQGDTGIDFYYLIVADGITVEPLLYPEWGVINEQGKVIRRAKRMKREGDTKQLVENIAHVLVYKVFGKLYFK